MILYYKNITLWILKYEDTYFNHIMTDVRVHCDIFSLFVFIRNLPLTGLKPENNQRDAL